MTAAFAARPAAGAAVAVAIDRLSTLGYRHLGIEGRVGKGSALQGHLSDWRARSGASGISVAVRLNGRIHWTSTDSDDGVIAVFDALLAGKILRAKTLADMLALTPIPGHQPSGKSPGCGMGILSDCASPRGRRYGHGGGGPGYDLDVTVFPASPLGRLTVATFVNTSSGPRAEECETELLSVLLDDAE